MAYKLMIQGTMSSAGKSFIVTALCRMFSNLGYKVAPFKSQNMALNSGVTFDGLEMGRAQIAQAEAARAIPDVRMNPVLLKPNSDIGSQVIVMGKPIGNMKAAEYYEYKKSLIPIIMEAFHSLENEYDVIIVEGAGSPAEINLKANDIVNMGLAEMLDIPVLLVGDIDLGGVFAQLLGTLEWLDENEKDRIKGLIINKFRGDVNLLTPGVKMLEERVSKKVIGVIPYSNASIDEEDSVTRNINVKDEADADQIKVYVIRLPHLSNFTDFTPLANVKEVSLSYINSIPDDVPDLLIIPGSKNTIADLKFLKESGLFDYIKTISGKTPIMGICGGYQMLGHMVNDPHGVEGDTDETGLSLIDISTELSIDKTLTKSEGRIEGVQGFFSCFNGCKYSGYEIHAGISVKNNRINDEKFNSKDAFVGTESTIYMGNSEKGVFGTYIHGFFDKGEIVSNLINTLRERKGLSSITYGISDYSDVKNSEYEKAAKTVVESLNLDELYKIMGIEK